jgi:sugar fermentation stimulation protein A
MGIYLPFILFFGDFDLYLGIFRPPVVFTLNLSRYLFIHTVDMLTSMTPDGKPVHTVDWDNEAVVVSRPNRFLLIANIQRENGEIISVERVHVHDPGRLKEIIFPGNRIRIKRAIGRSRSTNWDLVAGQVSGKWVLVNSSFHRAISEKILSNPDMTPIKGIEEVNPEFRIGRSRLDFMLEMVDGGRCFVEVKGCTLSMNGKALFPDAPTSRGTRHLNELISLSREGHRSAILILVLAPNSHCFSPNFDTDPLFSETFFRAMEAGVEVHPMLLHLDGKEIRLDGLLPVCIDGSYKVRDKGAYP